MKIKEVGFFAVVIFFRCVAALLVGTAVFSIIGIIFSFSSIQSAGFWQIFAKAIFAYALAGIGTWLAAKPLARLIVADLHSVTDGKNDVLRESLRDQ